MPPSEKTKEIRGPPQWSRTGGPPPTTGRGGTGDGRRTGPTHPAPGSQRRYGPPLFLVRSPSTLVDGGHTNPLDSKLARGLRRASDLAEVRDGPELHKILWPAATASLSTKKTPTGRTSMRGGAGPGATPAGGKGLPPGPRAKAPAQVAATTRRDRPHPLWACTMGGLFSCGMPPVSPLTPGPNRDTPSGVSHARSPSQNLYA